MKALKLFTLLGIISVLSVSCSSSFKMASSSSGDDIYYNPSKASSGQLASASSGNHVVVDQSYQDLIAQTNRAMSDTIYVESDSTGNPYQDALADSYEKAKRNRELGMQDPWNGMPTFYTSTNSFWYANAYDPAFYNIIVMGNTVWAEPKYISAMFGYPYYSPYINFGSYYSPWRNWSLGFNFGFNSFWGSGYPYYDPFWGPGWGCGYYPWDYPYYGHSYYPSYGWQAREVVYGPRNASRYNSNASGASYAPSRGVGAARGAGRSQAVTSNRPSTSNPYATSSRRDMVSREQGAGRPATISTSRRPSAISQTRPASNVNSGSYTPSYNRPSRSDQNVFNDGNRGVSQGSSRRSSAVATPRSERPAVQYNSGNSSSSSSTYSGRSTYSEPRNSYTPTQSSSGSYSAPSRSSSESSSRSSEPRSGGRR